MFKNLQFFFSDFNLCSNSIFFVVNEMKISIDCILNKQLQTQKKALLIFLERNPSPFLLTDQDKGRKVKKVFSLSRYTILQVCLSLMELQTKKDNITFELPLCYSCLFLYFPYKVAWKLPMGLPLCPKRWSVYCNRKED